ncbi:hypothetical protein QPK32_18560 [Massilia sp. YIM B02763]|uniref:hypothetical protein n=1 Tax=Massilia sp. YIM B02763 TaxID=3050130 RepID=UPI0025B6D684|nr:hypothetical protein [Massilia sp. YIM B02763]MDN4055078.1 hypothetical protein [Massilia sp. YIM B02763]
MDAHHGNDLRTDLATASSVQQALELCTRQGVHPALLFMEEAGVPRAVALRVLCSPQHFRQRDRRQSARPAR